MIIYFRLHDSSLNFLLVGVVVDLGIVDVEIEAMDFMVVVEEGAPVN